MRCTIRCTELYVALAVTTTTIDVQLTIYRVERVARVGACVGEATQKHAQPARKSFMFVGR
jgi:hypothetical protein